MVWNISKAEFVQELDISAAAGPGLFISPSGTKMYHLRRAGANGFVYEYTLGTAWNISTAVYVQNLDVYAKESAVFGVAFKPDGTKMYLSGAGNKYVHEYTLSVAWDISTATFTADHEIIGEIFAGSSVAISFKDDGTMMYLSHYWYPYVTGFFMSSAWDLSTLTKIQTYNYDTAKFSAATRGISFKPDGTKVYMTDGNQTVLEFNATIPWDISSVVYLRERVLVAPSGIRGLFLKSDGTKMYTNTNGYEIQEYELPSSKHRPVMSS